MHAYNYEDVGFLFDCDVHVAGHTSVRLEFESLGNTCHEPVRVSQLIDQTTGRGPVPSEASFVTKMMALLIRHEPLKLQI